MFGRNYERLGYLQQVDYETTNVLENAKKSACPDEGFCFGFSTPKQLLRVSFI